MRGVVEPGAATRQVLLGVGRRGGHDALRRSGAQGRAVGLFVVAAAVAELEAVLVAYWFLAGSDAVV